MRRAIILCIFFVPSPSMEVFASQLGSVESLRKANNVPGNNTNYGSLNCSICARVKHETGPSRVNPAFPNVKPSS